MKLFPTLFAFAAGQNFIYVNQEISWSDAEAHCQSNYGTRLASIHSATENGEAVSLCGAGECWIGLNDITTEGTFVWSDGTSTVYTAWSPGEPNDGGDGEDCGSLRNPAFGGDWNDLPCDFVRNFLCNSPTPSPTQSPSKSPTKSPTGLPSVSPTKSPTGVPSVGPTKSPSKTPTTSPTFLNCETDGGVKHLQWNALQNAADNSDEVPFSDITFNFDESSLTLSFDITLEYLGNSSDPNTQQSDLGTTYVIDFQAFDDVSSFTGQIGNCQNRKVEDFGGAFDTFFTYSDYPYLSGNLADATTLAYPPPGDFWTLESTSGSECSRITYSGSFTWDELTKCRAGDGTQELITLDDTDSDVIKLTGTLYVSAVSPFNTPSPTVQNNFRAFPLAQQPFEIALVKQINVLSSTGINLFIASILAVSQDEETGDYEITLLTQSADYMSLDVGSEGDFGVISHPLTDGAPDFERLNSGCLSATTYTCAQLFKLTISADDSKVTCNAQNEGEADLRGLFFLHFTPSCRDVPAQPACSTFLADNDGEGVRLEFNSNFIDRTCNPETYDVIFEGQMAFFEDETFTTPQGTGVDDAYVIGQDTIYVQTTVSVPDPDTNLDIFNVVIENVFVCTAAEGTDLLSGLDQQDTDNLGGCFAADVDADSLVTIFSGGSPVASGEAGYFAQIIEEDDSNVVRFSFRAFDIGRGTMTVHVQLMLELQEEDGSRRRLQTSSATSSQSRAFVADTSVVDATEEQEPEQEPEQEGGGENEEEEAESAVAKQYCFVSLLFAVLMLSQA